MKILDLFKLSKDPINEVHLTSCLYIGKLYSTTQVGGEFDYDTPMQADLVSSHYRLFVKYHNKYYVIPVKDTEKVQMVYDINDVKNLYDLAIQPDTQKRFKSFLYYAPSSKYHFVTPEQLRKLAKFVHHYFVKGDNHSHRRDLDIYFKFLKNMELSTEEKERLIKLKNFAQSLEQNNNLEK